MDVFVKLSRTKSASSVNKHLIQTTAIVIPCYMALVVFLQCPKLIRWLQKKNKIFNSGLVRKGLCSRGNFYGKPLAAGSHSWLPTPLECSLADAKNARTVHNNRNEVQLLLHDVYFIRSKIHRST
jgi:hypothetical protein